MHPLYDQKLKQIYSQPDLKILDIGGWFAPCRQATHMVDLMPFETMNRSGAYGYGDLKIRSENYFQMDLGAVERLPFADKEFDYIVCRHTLEDLKDPIRVCREMIRIGKAGYIETPHRVYESTKGVERHWWAGHYHHRWFVEVIDDKISFQFKPHNLHSSSRFTWRAFPWQKIREEYKNTSLFWDSLFVFRENIIVEYQDTKNDLINFKKKYAGKKIMKFKWS